MSVENRPNLHGVGLLVDIVEAINKRRRGKAGEASDVAILDLLHPTICQFIEDVDSILDQHFPA